jgi:hypothetical protein
MSRAIIVGPSLTVRSAFPALEGPVKLQEGQAPEATPQPPPAKPDTYGDRLIKYIPSEVIALHLALTKILMAATTSPHALYWVIFVVGLIATFTYMRFAKPPKVSWPQTLIAVAAFAVWVFAIGEPFSSLSWYLPVYGALLLPIFTFFAPFYVPKPAAA